MTRVRRARRGWALSATDVAAAAQLACLLEVSAPKPGNVSPGRHFADTRYEDFLASAAAIGAPLARRRHAAARRDHPPRHRSHARWTRSNTNLGIVLLLAPLARGGGVRPWTLDRSANVAAAAAVAPRSRASSRHHGRRCARRRTRPSGCASPGGLGRAEAQDVADEPTMTLLEAMRLAADRDGIAREYATDVRDYLRDRRRLRSTRRAATASTGTTRSWRRF